MPPIRPVIVGGDLLSAFGRGIKLSWEGILNGQSAITQVKRFPAQSFQSENAAILSELKYPDEDSLVMQMLEPLLKSSRGLIPADARLILATTTGEIDLLERQVLQGTDDAAKSNFDFLLEKVRRLTGVSGEGEIISSACASSSIAIGFAAGFIESGKGDCALVVAADAVTEFVFSGFSSLMALDPGKAKPFDKNRAGLSLGEGAGFILLMSRERAEKESRDILGEVAGWAQAGDANHMTGPSRDGAGLSLAIQKAMNKAGIRSQDVGCISSHGTGTLYNDSMEMKAYRTVFGDQPVPLYSIKGAMGHTMGAAGLMETLIALQVLREKIIPATVGLQEVDPEAEGWVSLDKRALRKNFLLLNNSGFGGVNAALILKH
ncbi:MAG: beta-ketoacyl synthase N-terminal-like domain-containing protein [Candidatus Omnitrophota bacterium]